MAEGEEKQGKGPSKNPVRNAKERLYDKMTVTVGQLDAFLIALLILVIVLIVVGALVGKGIIEIRIFADAGLGLQVLRI